MLSLFLFGACVAFGAGLAVGRRLERWYTLPAPLDPGPGHTAHRKRTRFRRRHYSPPGVMPRLVKEAELTMRRMAWDTALINFALKASLCRSLSERAVVGAGVVGVSDYRLYQWLLRSAGAWSVRGTGSRARWAAGWNVSRLRRELRQGGIAPPYPAHGPPDVAGMLR